MSEKTYRLSKSGIFVRMMRYIWNLDHRDFDYMCPFFWLCVVNCVVIVPYFLVKESWVLSGRVLKTVRRHVKFLFDLIDAYLEEQARLSREKYIMRVIESGNDEALSKRYIKQVKEHRWEHEVRLGEGVLSKFLDIVNRFENKRRNEEADAAIRKQQEKERIAADRARRREEAEFWAAARGRLSYAEADEVKRRGMQQSFMRDLKREADEREAKRRLANKRRINAILRVVRPIIKYSAYTAGACIVAMCLYYMWIGLLLAGSWASDVQWASGIANLGTAMWSGTAKVCYCVLVIGGIATWVIWRVVRSMETWNIPWFDRTSDASRFFDLVWKIASYPFRKAWALGSLVVTMVKNECPPIDWND